MPFSLKIWTVKYCQKLGIFKFLFLFHFNTIFYSLSSRQLPTRPLFLIVLYNGVKKHSREKGLICDVGIGTENSDCLHKIQKHVNGCVCKWNYWSRLQFIKLQSSLLSLWELTSQWVTLSHLFPIFTFDPPEKSKVFWCFHEVQQEALAEMGQKSFAFLTL